MNWNRIEGNWKQVRGKLQEQWGRLTDDQLVGRIQESYGIAKDEAERQVKEWETRNRNLFN